MTLFAEYIKELAGKEIIESEKGFATYYFFKDYCYIEDIYVRPDFRKDHVAASMADDIAVIAKSQGYSKLAGSIKPSNKNSTASMKVLLAYGFKIDSCVNDAIALVKEI